jgi:hypothetical protein
MGERHAATIYGVKLRQAACVEEKDSLMVEET